MLAFSQSAPSGYLSVRTQHQNAFLHSLPSFPSAASVGGPPAASPPLDAAWSTRCGGTASKCMQSAAMDTREQRSLARPPCVGGAFTKCNSLRSSTVTYHDSRLGFLLSLSQAEHIKRINVSSQSQAVLMFDGLRGSRPCGEQWANRLPASADLLQLQNAPQLQGLIGSDLRGALFV